MFVMRNSDDRHLDPARPKIAASYQAQTISVEARPILKPATLAGAGAQDKPASIWTFQQAARPASSRAKRLMDIVVSATALVLFAPLMLVIAALIRLDGPGPVIFRQARGGLNGVPFEILKFRTMRVSADASATHATRGDSRVTPIGAFLRRSSVDELPQLVNVLRGEMSLVGPRPHAVAHDEHYERHIPHYRERMRVRPGLTGLAQVNGLRGHTANPAAMAERIANDLAYIESWTLIADIKLILVTLFQAPFDPQAL